uniref:Uncharacterized protein n=1 Tax=Ciona intestinalis TaxID=7719 RepID=H2XR27_CIOIN
MLNLGQIRGVKVGNLTFEFPVLN